MSLPDLGNTVILGATGLVGQALSRFWPSDSTLWQHRPNADISGIFRPNVQHLNWDILNSQPPALSTPVSSIIVLSGVMGVDERALAANTELALAAVKAGRIWNAKRVLVASSQAVYGNYQPCMSEIDACRPEHPYGRAKLSMEQALAGFENVTCLRFGNVAGADSLFRAASRHQGIQLDRFADGHTPRRSYIGPQTLARVLSALLSTNETLPPVLNLANPGMHSMDALMHSADVPFTLRDAPDTAIPALELDVSRLQALVPLSPTTPDELIREASLGGWVPAQNV